MHRSSEPGTTRVAPANLLSAQKSVHRSRNRYRVSPAASSHPMLRSERGAGRNPYFVSSARRAAARDPGNETRSDNNRRDDLGRARVLSTLTPQKRARYRPRADSDSRARSRRFRRSQAHGFFRPHFPAATRSYGPTVDGFPERKAQPGPAKRRGGRRFPGEASTVRGD